jgi:hypothetical protein
MMPINCNESASCVPNENVKSVRKGGKPVLCKVCRELIAYPRPMQKVCGWECSLKLVELGKAKEQRKIDKAIKADTRKALERLKTRSQWMKEAQAVFNRYIRLRDANDGCISCGKRNNVKQNAGHYLSVGARPELRFNEWNVHKQCEACNTYLSGNLVAYRGRLVDKVGLLIVEWLEGPHEPLKLSIDDIKAIKAKYQAKIKEMAE